MAVSLLNVKAIQTIINSRHRIDIDGNFGVHSRTAFRKLIRSERTIVLGAARMLNIPTQSLLVSPPIVSLDEIIGKSERIGEKLGVSSSAIQLIVDLENFKAPNGKGYRVSMDGTFQGLGQFDEATWVSVSPRPFSDASNTDASLFAIARLYERNKQSFVVQGHDPARFSDEMAYLYHNQGASSADSFLRTGEVVFPKQSRLAKLIFTQARNDYGIGTT